MWLVIWALAAAPISVMEVLRNVDGLATWPLHGVTVVALLAAAFGLVGRSSSGFWINTLLISIAVLVAWLSFRRFALSLSVIPTGDLLAPISYRLFVAFERGRRLGNQQLPLGPAAAG